MGCYSSTGRRIEVEIFEGNTPCGESKTGRTISCDSAVDIWTKTVQFPPGRHLRKLDFGSVVHDKFEIDPAVPHVGSLQKDWHFIHFLWFPLTLNDEPFSWDSLGEAERKGTEYRIRFHQKRCELVKRKFYVGGKDDISHLTKQDLERDVTTQQFARIFCGNKTLVFTNKSKVPMRVRTGSQLETQIDPSASKTLDFDTNNDGFFSIIALFGGDWQELPDFARRSFEKKQASYILSEQHISKLEQKVLLTNSDLSYGGAAFAH